ncbi:MAG: anhydro-N-acetylmuramic acid kinase [Phycisphaerales bacterium]|nr:anhydro-N-acetylmuramic acid kinase [Phycisphaerales bacterium]
MTASRLIAGCMSGTSLDGLDAAVCRVRLGDSSQAVEVLATHSVELGPVGRVLRDLASGVAVGAGEIAEAALGLGRLHLTCLEPLLPAADGPLDLIVAHGQTVFHDPPCSWQLLNPAPIAAALGVPVLSDLRQGDLALGGQGAPITPRADAVLYRGLGPDLAVVNLGGFCNVTLPGDHLRGFDVCACNQVLDGAARRWLRAPCDVDGKAALVGTADEALVAELDGLLEGQRLAGRSLGSGDELEAWIAGCAGSDAATVCASACAAVARCIARAVGAVPEVILAGGGVRNPALRGALERACAGRVRVSDEVGVPAAYREAAAMAVLGAMALAGENTTDAGVTGRRPGPVISGSWTGPGVGVARAR